MNYQLFSFSAVSETATAFVCNNGSSVGVLLIILSFSIMKHLKILFLVVLGYNYGL